MGISLPGRKIMSCIAVGDGVTTGLAPAGKSGFKASPESGHFFNDVSFSIHTRHFYVMMRLRRLQLFRRLKIGSEMKDEMRGKECCLTR